MPLAVPSLQQRQVYRMVIAHSMIYNIVDNVPSSLVISLFVPSTQTLGSLCISQLAFPAPINKHPSKLTTEFG